jgi:hypothetical protein
MLKFKNKNKDTSPDTEEYTEKFRLANHANYDIADDRVGLGAYAVKGALKRTEEARLEGHDEESPHYGRAIYGGNIERSLGIWNARAQLEDLNLLQIASANEVLNNAVPSSWIDRRLGFNGDDEYKDYVGKIKEVDTDGNYVVDDELFLNFLEWNNYQLALAQLEIDENKESIKKDFKNKIQKAVKKDWIPKWVSDDRLNERIDEVTIATDDGFGTYVKQIGGNAMRLSTGHNEIVVMPAHLIGEKAEKIFTHELTHVMDGYGLDDDNSSKRESDNYGMTRLFGEEYGGNAMNEAVVEHFADSLISGHPDVIDPYAKVRDNSAYFSERVLLNVLSTMGKKPINIRLFFAAHFQHKDTDTIDGKQPLELLEQEIKEAFPDIDVIGEIKGIMDSKEIAPYTADLRRRLGREKSTKHEAEMRGDRKSYKKVAAIGAVAAAGIIGVPIAQDALAHMDSPYNLQIQPHGSENTTSNDFNFSDPQFSNDVSNGRVQGLNTENAPPQTDRLPEDFDPGRYNQPNTDSIVAIELPNTPTDQSSHVTSSGPQSNGR